MNKIDVTISQSPEYRYPIYIGSQLLSKVGEIIEETTYTRALVITDSHVEPLFLTMVTESLHIPTTDCIITPGENAKSIETLMAIWQKCIDNKLDRKSVIINLGGGVIGDIGGFAASTYMRGIDFINIPTTTLSQVDESVGGKTMINFGGYKNNIGTFQQPTAVIIDVTTLKTLPEREFNSGFAEIIKHGLIADKAYFELVTSKKPKDFSYEELEKIITGSCEIKRNVVQHDTKESGERKKLNFGHTIGHSIEAISLDTETPLLHGEAVSIGMVAEAKISELLGLISEDDVKLIKQLLSNAGLPVTFVYLDKAEVIAKAALDKKNIDGKIKWTLLKNIGEAIYDKEVSEEFINTALNYITHE